MKNLIKVLLKACHICYGMKVIEQASGDTIPCPACKGKGVVE